MLRSEGFKMFRGKGEIRQALTGRLVEVQEGDWLYNPEYDVWYVNGRSYPAECVRIVRDDTENTERVETNLYEEVATYPNCTVQILKNVLTGQVSVGWWRNDE